MGNSASALPYSIDNQVGAPHDHNGWALHNGKSTDSAKREVSLFIAKKPDLVKQPMSPRFPQLTRLVPALHHYNNSRKLRHPHILKVYATLDTDNPTAATTDGGGMPAAESASSNSAAKTTGDLIIVTEPCISLNQWLLSNPTPEQLAWGLECLVRGLWFMHNDAKLVHGNLSPTSFYVTRSGDVKLWNFSLVTPVGPNHLGPTPHFQEWEMACTPDAYRSPERVERRWNHISNAGIHAMDSYGLGILIDHWFNGKIPQRLQKAVQRLQTSNIKMRPRLQPLLKCPVFDTPYQKLQLQLEEIVIQPVEQKIRMWQDLGTSMQMGKVPSDVALHKILPLLQSSISTICCNESMLSQDMYRREVLAMLQPLFYVVESHLDANKVGAELGPLVGMLFKVQDRGVRGALLTKVEFMSQHLDKNTLNSSVFGPLCSGFNDSSPALREMTLKATLGLVPFLNAPNLEKLSRYLVRLQSDTETSIRTNAVIFIAKIAPQLSEVSMQKMLLPSYIRAFKDPFPPCRLAALQSTTKSKALFKMPDLASKVMPAVMPLTLDPMPNVRKEAFGVINQFLVALKQESDRMETQARQDATQQIGQHQQQQPTVSVAPTSGGAVAPAPSSGSYLSGLSSWMSSSTQPQTDATVAQPMASPVAPAPMPILPVRAPAEVAPPVQQFASSNLSAPAVDDGDDDGWGDESGWADDDDGDDLGTSTYATPTKASASSSYSTSNQFSSPSQFSADQDDPFASIGIKSVAPRAPMSKGKLIMPKKKTAGPVVKAAAPATKLKLDHSDLDDGWDDF